MFSLALVFAAAAAAQPAVKWVPLNAPKPKPEAAESKPAPAPVPAPSEPASAVPQSPESAAAELPASAVTQSAAVSGRLDLTCMGGGTANKLAVANTFGSSSFSGSAGFVPFSGSASGSATTYGQRQQAFGDQVDVRLFGGDDRIRMPRTMLPALRGGKDGWFKLKNVVADARSIRASAAVNVLNNPKVHIDRVTGTISISGKAGDYAGQCQAIDASAPARF